MSTVTESPSPINTPSPDINVDLVWGDGFKRFLAEQQQRELDEAWPVSSWPTAAEETVVESSPRPIASGEPAIRGVAIRPIRSEQDAYFWCEWFAECYHLDEFQGWECIRRESDGQIWQLRAGSLSALVDVAWAWQNRKSINSYIRQLLEG